VRVPPKRLRPLRPLRTAYRRRVWPRGRSAPHHAMASGGAQAQTPHRPRWAPRSKARWLHGSLSVRHSSTNTGGACWPRTSWTARHSRPRSGPRGIQAKGMRNAAFVSSRTHAFWPRALSQEARADHGTLAGEDGVPTRVCDGGVPHAPSAHRPGAHLASPTGHTRAEPDRAVGLVLFWWASLCFSSLGHGLSS
jgi:hypothetical protein